jgi:hypothetical protein
MIFVNRSFSLLLADLSSIVKPIWSILICLFIDIFRKFLFYDHGKTLRNSKLALLACCFRSLRGASSLASLFFAFPRLNYLLSALFAAK